MRTLPELLNRYNPDPSTKRILLSATSYSAQADREHRALILNVAFPEIVGKKTLYRIEDEITDAYGLAYTKIMPSYPKELFTDAYIPELLCETERVGVVARGFFGKYTYRIENNCLTVEIPFIRAGVELLINAQTPLVMQRIIKSEFGIDMRVDVVNSEEVQESISPHQRSILEQADRQIQSALRSYGKSDSYKGAAAEEKPGEEILPRVGSLFSMQPAGGGTQDGAERQPADTVQP